MGKAGKALADLTEDTCLLVIGCRLYARRRIVGLTQAELAKKAGLSTRTIIRMESGECCSLFQMMRFARACGSSAAEILTDL